MDGIITDSQWNRFFKALMIWLQYLNKNHIYNLLAYAQFFLKKIWINHLKCIWKKKLWQLHTSKSTNYSIVKKSWIHTEVITMLRWFYKSSEEVVYETWIPKNNSLRDYPLITSLSICRVNNCLSVSFQQK